MLPYENAKIWCTTAMFENLPTDMEFCGYFVYLTTQEDLVFTSSRGYFDKRQSMEQYLKENVHQVRNTNKWQLLSVEGTLYAFHVSEMQDARYGTFIDLSLLSGQMAENIGYDQFEIVIDADVQAPEKNDVVMAKSRCDRGNWDIAIFVENVNVLENAQLWQMIQYVLIILCLASAPLLVFILRKNVLKPLWEINKAHHQLEVGNRNYRIRGHAGSKELELAYQSFNQMADNIDTLQIEVMEQQLKRQELELLHQKVQLERQELELENLQLQIRPHFLMNTFNLMFNLAEKKEISSLQSLILYLSSYFRYLLHGKHRLELFDKEKNLIDQYMKVAALRYPGRVELAWQIDPEISFIRVPPLLLHNFVENAINHAMKDEGCLFIMICATYEDQEVLIQISDNGKGMENALVEQMNQGIFDGEHGVHMGLANSYRRLKAAYGEAAVLHIDSVMGEGTVFTITLPYDLEEEEE